MLLRRPQNAAGCFFFLIVEISLASTDLEGRYEGMKCSLCGSERLRPSHLRRFDVSRLFLFQYPIRCSACYERRYVNMVAALRIRRESRARKRAARESGRLKTNAKGA